MLVTCLVGALVYALAFVPDRTVDTKARDRQVQTCRLGNDIRAAVRDLNDVIVAYGLPASSVPNVSGAWQRILERAFRLPDGLTPRRCSELFDNNGEEQ